MSDPAVEIDAADALYEQFLEDIPCGSCGKAAHVFSRGHGCTPPPASAYKCISCWQRWYRGALNQLAVVGKIKCRRCQGIFTTVETFSDFRPF